MTRSAISDRATIIDSYSALAHLLALSPVDTKYDLDHVVEEIREDDRLDEATRETLAKTIVETYDAKRTKKLVERLLDDEETRIAYEIDDFVRETREATRR